VPVLVGITSPTFSPLLPNSFFIFFFASIASLRCVFFFANESIQNSCIFDFLRVIQKVNSIAWCRVLQKGSCKVAAKRPQAPDAQEEALQLGIRNSRNAQPKQRLLQ